MIFDPFSALESLCVTRPVRRESGAFVSFAAEAGASHRLHYIMLFAAERLQRT